MLAEKLNFERIILSLYMFCQCFFFEIMLSNICIKHVAGAKCHH